MNNNLIEQAREIITNGCGCDKGCDEIGRDICGCRNDAAAIVALVLQSDFAALRAKNVKLHELLSEIYSCYGYSDPLTDADLVKRVDAALKEKGDA